MGPTCDWCIRHFPYLDIADLTAEGSFPLGAGIAAVSITNGYHPLTACLLGFLGVRQQGLFPDCFTQN